MAEVNEQTKPGPNGDTAATASWNKKLSGLDKSSFPAKGPNTRKPPIDKAMNVTVEGKTHKDSDDNKNKSNKFAAIKQARENKKKSQVQDEETFTTLDLVEAVISRKPGSCASIFDIIMKDSVTDLVAERRLELARSVFGEQETVDDEELADEEKNEEDAEVSDETEEPETDEQEGEVEEEEEEINELSAAIKSRYRTVAKADAKKKAHFFSRLSDKTKSSPQGQRFAAKALRRFKAGVSEEELTDPANNTKPHVHSTRTGNSEKKQHAQDTLNRLRKVSVTKAEKAAIKDFSN